ncbi:glucans biosynthesis glucosyltransferase MdoH [uncultured Cardiobacterium sp.]|uniref:glucans biosynthesis glucosyltransferase MdoH n=1 Tax=uncultured Cardiobacterium sp. TaxID=417619 RepID=UPI002612E0B7|nr:glucans biosynthesis glucosyltransferase MdoH [uncultured Cardiobacterium sp.]
MNTTIPAVPPEAPLNMRVQSLRKAPGRPPVHTPLRTHLARLVAFGGALAIGTLGSWHMLKAFGDGRSTLLQYILLIFFALTFYWVAFSTTACLAGLLPQRRHKGALNPQGGKVALLMPVYGEDPALTHAALLAMARQLSQTALAGRAEIFIISDTQKPDAWLGETAALHILREQSPLPVWYRRRAQNSGRKSGNVENFVRRWGGRYDYMIMLDADSLMEADTLVEMVARMDAEPRLGLLQTMPHLIGGHSLLARAIQFAGALYGPIVARGVAAWQGEDGNYWGHNAIIRVRAFADSCGLPILRGRNPIGGHIMSHDFVEAALLRRAGWHVRMDPDLGGSYEGLPPTLDDLVGRERRWAQGNMQHLGIIGAKGLRWPSRIHFLIGIASYIMSPIWLIMLIVGTGITAQTLFTKPKYFTSARQLFPDWPTFDPKRMLWLFFAAISLLLLPKFIGWLRVLISGKRRRAFGGTLAVSKGFIAELIISTLYAPLLMLIQTRHVIDIFLGRDSGWRTQNREGALLPWGEAIKRNLLYVAIAIIVLCGLIWQAPNQIIWLSPIIIGLFLSPWLSRHSGNTRLGSWLAHKRILLIPEETSPPAIATAAAADSAAFAACRSRRIAELGRDRALAATHIAALDPTAPQSTKDRLLHITAKAKLQEARHYAEALKYLTPQELMHVAGSAELIETLLNLPE